MQLIETVAAVRAFGAEVRACGKQLALVPTMGALHEGHLSLIRAAVAEGAEVVISIFVNPAQFNDPADLAKYPRNLQRDVELAASAGASAVFAPSVAEVYPAGFATSIRVGGVSELWEGASRGASHFDGVALVVTKLLCMVGPDVAWFGQKDAQQVAVIRRVAADLNLPSRIATGPTVRAESGLALSSRNARLREDETRIALALSATLRRAQARLDAGEHDAAALASSATAALEEAGARVEYWAVVDPDSFAPLERVEAGTPALAIVAAWAGDVRLIDNAALTA
ncbi:MAG: pantoate--beta-alanine ligase [Arthrobacter sp.]|nr:pantoate--beta-alanine ligase [Arthrobacter sp.]